MSTTDAIERLWRRMQLVVGRGRITTGNDAGVVQTQQVQMGELETRDNTKRVAEYGFTSMPLPGCHGVVIFVGGDRSNGVIIGTNDQNHRLKNLKPGEVAIYDDQGQSVYLTRTGIVVEGAGLPLVIQNAPTVTIKASTKIRFETPLLEVTGIAKIQNLQIGLSGAGSATMTGGSISYSGVTTTYTGGSITHDGHALDKTHVHPVTAVGSNTGTPV